MAYSDQEQHSATEIKNIIDSLFLFYSYFCRKETLGNVKLMTLDALGMKISKANVARVCIANCIQL